MHKAWTVSSAVRNSPDTTYVVASNNVAGWSETAASSPTSACAPGLAPEGGARQLSAPSRFWLPQVWRPLRKTAQPQTAPTWRSSWKLNGSISEAAKAWP